MRQDLRAPVSTHSVAPSGGYILIVAMLVLLALTSLGIAAVEVAANHLNLTGSVRIAQVARTIAASGAEGTMAFAGMNPSGFTQFVAAQNGLVQMRDLSAGFYDTSTDGSGSFGREAVTMNTAFWQSRMTSAVTTHRAPGFGVGEYCFRRYISETEAVFRNDLAPGSPNAQTLTIDRDAQARAMAAIFVGPVGCP
ncbi:MAG TPA: hypothetical protein PLQ97_02040 [Myxococcota bacterium]|nr:hypothetical protein [Myxococcota bacterium]HQK50331.1 hypothetical protein [Myxococcota bacterium]